MKASDSFLMGFSRAHATRQVERFTKAFRDVSARVSYLPKLLWFIL